MKFLKHSLMILAVAVMTNVMVISAQTYASSSQITVIQELKQNNQQWTGYKTKDNYNRQKYNNTSTYTWMTNPCPDCQIATRPYSQAGEVGTTRITKTGDTKPFDSPTSLDQPGSYRLQIWRYDATLLDTHHTGIWTIN